MATRIMPQDRRRNMPQDRRRAKIEVKGPKQGIAM